MDTLCPTLPAPDDRRGFILIVACVMGALLVGALWYVASVGDAIVFRERMQDAADATAFEDAVWQARGMNAIAMLNIVMAAVLAVLVALRVVELLCAAYITVTLLVCFIPGLDVACPPLADFLPTVRSGLKKVLDLDNKIAPKIMDAIFALNQAEEVVAAAAPVLATLESSLNNMAFYGSPIDATVGLSLSLVPPAVDNKISESGSGGNGFPVRMGTLTPGKKGAIKENRSGTDSLPVSEDDFSVLCAHAAEFLPNQFGQLAERIGADDLAAGIDEFDAVLGKIASSIPSLACTPWKKTALQSQLETAVDKHCDEEKDQYEKTHSSEAGKVSPPYTQKMEDKCKEENEKILGQNIPSSETCTPAQVWDISRNGSVFMQTWSAAISGGPPMQTRDDKGLVVADHGSRSHLVENASTGGALSLDTVNLGVAEAEYYFDCAGDWDGCKDDAMWRLGWTARMRRIWSPIDELNLDDIASSMLTNQLSDAIEKRVGAATSKLKGIDALLTQSLFETWISEPYIVDQVPSVSGFDGTGYWLMQHVGGGKRRTIIH
jgi:hypothetical protein